MPSRCELRRRVPEIPGYPAGMGQLPASSASNTRVSRSSSSASWSPVRAPPRSATASACDKMASLARRMARKSVAPSPFEGDVQPEQRGAAVGLLAGLVARRARGASSRPPRRRPPRARGSPPGAGRRCAASRAACPRVGSAAPIPTPGRRNTRPRGRPSVSAGTCESRSSRLPRASGSCAAKAGGVGC